MKLVTVVGARPQFIKAAAISRALREPQYRHIDECIVHTGQHFDANMSDVFFQELDIPRPKYNLEISGGTHGRMTGRMLMAIEEVLTSEAPDWLVVYGDTNSTLAGALAAAKMHIRVAHVEAGLRSFNMRMPEEINRVVVDRISTLLFCPTTTAVSNLAAEGMTAGVHHTGDVMYDVALYQLAHAGCDRRILETSGLTEGAYALATCHRAENTDDERRLGQILKAMDELSQKIRIVFPLHPRTRALIGKYGLSRMLSNLMVMEPVSFSEMVELERCAEFILTDSGGVQKEAFFYQVPCITMRDETEWVETVESGWNHLTGADALKIVSTATHLQRPSQTGAPYGAGKASQSILDRLSEY